MFLKGFYKSKKGAQLLPEQIVKIVLSLIAVVLILYLGVSLGMLLFGTNQRQLQAKGTTAYIYQQLLSLNENVKGKDIALYVPIGWTVVAFNNGNMDSNGLFFKPLAGNGKYYVCVCEKDCISEKITTQGCRQISKPLMMEVGEGENKQTKFFLWKINGVKHFYLSDQGAYYLLSERSLELSTTGAYSSPVSSSVVQNLLVDNTWTRIEGMRVSAYYTVFEGDFALWKNPDSETGRDSMYYCTFVEHNTPGFYETVKCEGTGIGSNGEMYSYDTIKETKELSPSEANPKCKYGQLTDTCLEPGRSIAVKRAFIPYLSAVYLQFKCMDKTECKQFCQDFNNHYYVAEDTGSGLEEKQIDLFVGAGKTQYQLAMSCIDNTLDSSAGLPVFPGIATVSPTPVELAEITAEDKGLNQGTA
ncbi:MAG: 3D domain-containing protein [Candidatus Pacearchaeota archaeon]|nr:3D domain-containing protein [Candidatus Pacearchaeota archaeon]